MDCDYSVTDTVAQAWMNLSVGNILSYSVSGCADLCICTDRPQTIATAMFLIPGFLPSTPSGPVLCTVQTRSWRICQPIGTTALPITP